MRFYEMYFVRNDEIKMLNKKKLFGVPDALAIHSPKDTDSAFLRSMAFPGKARH